MGGFFGANQGFSPWKWREITTVVRENPTDGNARLGAYYGHWFALFENDRETLSMNSRFRLPFLILIVAIVAFSTFAFASSQTGQPAGGEGASAVSGWTVSNIHYRIADQSPDLEGVEFDLNGPADVVRVSMRSTGAAFSNCVNPVGYHWVCRFSPSVKMSDLDELRVVATGG